MAFLSERVQLEFERDCYRRAERRVRAQLIRLQKAVHRTTRQVAQRSQRAQGAKKPRRSKRKLHHGIVR